MTSVRIGVHLPIAGPGASPEGIAQVAEEAERIGLDSVWTWERLMRPTVPIAMGGAGFEEHIQAMRAVWGPNPVHFDGRFYRIPEADIGPKPHQTGGPPVLAGAAAPAAVSRAGRLGLGLTLVIFDWASVKEYIETFRAAADDEGIDPDTLPVMLQVNGNVTTM